jgi:hypothetical protein
MMRELRWKSTILICFSSSKRRLAVGLGERKDLFLDLIILPH